MTDSNTWREGYFWLKYNWETRAMTFLPLYARNVPEVLRDDHETRKADLFDNVGEDETLHRCSIRLERPPEEWFLATEHFIETDHVAWQTLNCNDVMRRLSVPRLFPVLPLDPPVPDSPLTVPMHINWTKGDKKAMLDATFKGRHFRVTVEEVDD